MTITGISGNGVTIKPMHLSDRKKPCLVVQRGNKVVVLAYFSRGDASIDEWEKALDEMYGKPKDG